MSKLEIINTPGYYYSIAYCLVLFVIVSTNKQRIKGWKRKIIHIAFFVFMVGHMTLTAGASSWRFVIAMTITILLILIYLYVCCDVGLLNAGYNCARAFITGEFAASLCWQVYYYSVVRFQMNRGLLWQWGQLFIVYAVVFAILYFMERYIQRNGEELKVSSREFITVLLITLAVFVVSNMSYLSQSGIFSSRFASEVFMIRTLVDLSGVAVLYAYHMLVQEVNMKFEVDTLQNILEMQYRNYQLSQESIDIVNQKYHDMKHQIALLKAEANSEKSTRYLEQMEQEIKQYEAQNKTGNHVLDAVLTSKSIYCQSKEISLTCVVEGSLLSFMNDMDISSLFGNMLDNAIECTEKINEPEKRLIHLSVSGQKKFLCIHVENYCEEDVKFKNGMPLTTKKDKKFHGFGMKSIQSIVRKYNGSVTAEKKNTWFELRILIPLE